jgi:hypothetical protein
MDCETGATYQTPFPCGRKARFFLLCSWATSVRTANIPPIVSLRNHQLDQTPTIATPIAFDIACYFKQLRCQRLSWPGPGTFHAVTSENGKNSNEP